MINAGNSGDTTAGGLARLDWALADDPDAVILVVAVEPDAEVPAAQPVVEQGQLETQQSIVVRRQV